MRTQQKANNHNTWKGDSWIKHLVRLIKNKIAPQKPI